VCQEMVMSVSDLLCRHRFVRIPSPFIPLHQEGGTAFSKAYLQAKGVKIASMMTSLSSPCSSSMPHLTW